MPPAFIRSATNSFSTPSAITTAPLTRANAIVASMAAREPTLVDVIVRLRPSFRNSLEEAASSSSVEWPSPTSSSAKRMPSARYEARTRASTS